MSPDLDPVEQIKLQKRALRERAYSLRDAEPDKNRNSELICTAFTSLSAYREAGTVMFYLSCRSEVRTRPTVQEALGRGKQIVIPYCTADHEGRNKLGLWRLESLDELIPGMWKIPEPPKSRWGDPGQEIDPCALDLIMVPGVAFDAEGGRLGNGQGYYDRLLAGVRPDCGLFGAAFEAQMFDKVPMGRLDIYLDGVITEKGMYHGKGRGAKPAG